MQLRKIVILLILLPLGLFAQKKKPWNKPLYDAMPYHYGFAFTGGILDFSVTHSATFNSFDTVYSVEGIAKPLFGASIVGNLRLNENWDLRFLPGLYFGQRNLDYLLSEINGIDTSYYNHTMKIESTILQFPLLVKYRAVRESNYRPYVVFGVNYALDLAARKKIKPEEEPKIKLNAQDVYLEIGVGVDYYLPFFKLSTEVRFSYGMLNIVNYDGREITNAFDKLGSKMVTFVVYFE